MNKKHVSDKTPVSFSKLTEIKSKLYTTTANAQLLGSSQYTITRFYKPLGNI